MMAAMLGAERRRKIESGCANGRESDPGLLRAILLAAAVGYALYHVYPVVGPGPLFGARFP